MSSATDLPVWTGFGGSTSPHTKTTTNNTSDTPIVTSINNTLDNSVEHNVLLSSTSPVLSNKLPKPNSAVSSSTTDIQPIISENHNNTNDMEIAHVDSTPRVKVSIESTMNSIERNWYYTVICSFFEQYCYLFSNYEFSPQLLQDSLLCQRHICDELPPTNKNSFGNTVTICKCNESHCQYLATTHVRLLQLTHPRPNTLNVSTWQKAYRDMLGEMNLDWPTLYYDIDNEPVNHICPHKSPTFTRQQLDELKNPLHNDIHYNALPPLYKLALLKQLIDYQCESELLRNEIANSSVPQHVPYGYDDDNNIYYLFVQGNSARVHLYVQPYHSVDSYLDKYRRPGKEYKMIKPNDDDISNKFIKSNKSSRTNNNNDTKSAVNNSNEQTLSQRIQSSTQPPSWKLLATTMYQLQDLLSIWSTEATSTQFKSMIESIQTNVIPELERAAKRVERRGRREHQSYNELAHLGVYEFLPERSLRTRKPVSYAENNSEKVYDDDDDASDVYNDVNNHTILQTDEELARSLASAYSTRRKASTIKYSDTTADEDIFGENDDDDDNNNNNDDLDGFDDISHQSEQKKLSDVDFEQSDDAENNDSNNASDVEINDNNIDDNEEDNDDDSASEPADDESSASHHSDNSSDASVSSKDDMEDDDY